MKTAYKDKPITAKNDQADHFILFSSTDEGKTFDRIRSYRGEDDKTHLAVVRWKLPPMRNG